VGVSNTPRFSRATTLFPLCFYDSSYQDEHITSGVMKNVLKDRFLNAGEHLNRQRHRFYDPGTPLGLIDLVPVAKESGGSIAAAYDTAHPD